MNINNTNIVDEVLKNANTALINYGRTILLEAIGVRTSFNEIREISPELQQEILDKTNLDIIKKTLINKINELIYIEFTDLELNEISKKIMKRISVNIKNEANNMAIQEIKDKLMIQLKEDLKLEILELPEIKAFFIKKL